MSYVMTLRLPDGATLGRPARAAAGVLEVTVNDVADIPALRAEVAELGGEVVTENGSTSPVLGRGVGAGRWCVMLPSKMLGTSVQGARSCGTACICGLRLAGVEVIKPRLARASRVPGLATTREGFIVVAADLAAALVEQRLTEGVEILTVSGSAGVRLLLPNRQLVGGCAGRGGCAVCGREVAVIGGVSVGVPSRYSLQPAAVIPPGEGWAWHPAMTQQVVAISPGVREALLRLGAEFAAIPLRDVSRDEAWLAKEYR